ncbi:MAG: AAA family ATPase [Clostridia bacterium]|nr:AAA family ATPase [Clostridia bacterium]
MVNFIQFKTGYPVTLPHVGNRAFKFNKGINILFGPNGCGKSTILNTIKAYCGIRNAGWTDFNHPEGLADARNFPHAYVALSPDQCVANVMWDGTPTFYNDGVVKIDPNVFFNNLIRGIPNESHAGIVSEDEQLDILDNTPSTGQFRAIMTNKILNQIRNPPKLNKDDSPFKKYDFWENEINYWNKLAKTGPTTVLLDEPERALSIPMQEKLFHVVLPMFKDLQLIIATHSIFALNTPDVNLIEFERGYCQQCIKALKW